MNSEEKQKLFFTSRGLKLCGILEAPQLKNKAIIIMIHGYSSGKGGETYVKTSDLLTGYRKNTFRFDLAGNYESEGKFEKQTITTMIVDTLAAIKRLKKLGFKKFTLLGSCAGGLVALMVATKTKTEKIALIVPASHCFPQHIKKYSKNGINGWKKRGYLFYNAGPRGLLKVNYSFFEDFNQYKNLYSLIEKITCPVLILHGDKDESVALSDSEELVKHLQKGKLIVLKGGDHKLRVKNDRSKAIRIIAKWLAK